MRGLKTKDIRPALKLVKIMNLGEEIKNIAEKANDIGSAGVEIIGLILSRYADTESAEKAFMEFLSGPFEMSVDEVLELEIEELMKGIRQIGIDKLVNFFKTLRA